MVMSEQLVQRAASHFLTIVINGNEYLIESRALLEDDRNFEYRIFLGSVLIKDWAQGNIHDSFGIDLSGPRMGQPSPRL